MKNITLIMVLFCATQLVNAQETIPVEKHHINNGAILCYTISECTRNHTRLEGSEVELF
jgi:hypothetical protein